MRATSLSRFAIIVKMRVDIFLTILVDPLAAYAAPPAPPPCKRKSPPTSEVETKARFDKFVDAFIVNSNITAAFEYIAEDYIASHATGTPICTSTLADGEYRQNNGAKTGSAASWNFLGPLWGKQNFALIRIYFKDDMSWVNYRGSTGEVVDRFRWDAGCIAEHVGLKTH